MKILLVITKGEIGGAQQVVLNLAKNLKKENNDVVVGFGEGQYLKERLTTLNIPFHNFKQLKRSTNPLKNLFFILELKKFLDQNKFDVVHFHSSNTLSGAISAKLSKYKPKTIFTFHGLSVLDPNYEIKRPLRFLFWLYFKFFLLFVDEKIFICKYNLEIAKKIHLVKDGKIVYNTINQDELHFLDKVDARKILSEKCHVNLNDKFIIGSIGRLAYPKNYEFLISVFPKILKIKNNAVCVIIGEGSEREKYENLIKKLGLENKIFLPGEDQNASYLLKALDLFVLPSKYEGYPTVLLEAKLAEIPILASKVGGNQEILEANNLYETNDTEDFLAKVNVNK